MPQYILELTWTEKGKNNPVSVEKRREKAMVVANDHFITGWGGQPISSSDIISTDTGALWKVEGNDDDIRAVVAIWEGYGNVTVEMWPQ